MDSDRGKWRDPPEAPSCPEAGHGVGDPQASFSAETIAQSPSLQIRAAMRDLRNSMAVARQLFTASLRARYRRSALGYLWLIIPGLISALAFTLLRKGELFATGEVAIPYPVFVLSGVFMWQTFVSALMAPQQRLQQERRFLSVVPAPISGVILAVLGDVMLQAVVRLLLLLLVMPLAGIALSAWWLLLPLAFAAMIAAGFALGLMVAPVALLYDDIGSGLGMVANFGIFLSPVLYPVPDSSILMLNPLVYPMDAARDWIAGGAASAGVFWLFAIALLLLPAGWLLLLAARPHIAARAR